jgi:TRAP-type C4-dicarboxylate transport system permease small subunit
MKKILRMIAALLVAGAAIFWLAAGANRGWTKTHVPIKTMDAVTGLEGVQWQEKFVPGIDFLGAALLGAGVLAGISIFVPLRSKSKPPQNKTENETENENETCHPGSHRCDGHRPRRAADV